MSAAVPADARRLWAAGDFSVVGLDLVWVGEQLCEAIGLRACERVLDVATGSGNTAIAAARRRCDVTGVDFVPGLLERARERARAEGVALELLEGDAQALPVADGAYDVVLSTFGCMFARDARRTAAELARACRPGGRIGLACWTPEGFIGAFLRALAEVAPPAPGGDPPLRWGTADGVAALLGDATDPPRCERRTVLRRWRSMRHYVDEHLSSFGPTVVAHDALDAAGRARLVEALEAVARRFDTAGDGTLSVPCEYLEVVATRR